MAKTSLKQFRFQKTDSVGAPGAEEDNEFLPDCFVDTGDLPLLENPQGQHVIVLGRTGTGKSALLRELHRRHGDRVIQIRPDNLALTYLANSAVLNFFSELGINLYPFYKLLWRHVFTVEILTHFFSQDYDPHPQSLFDRLRSMFTGSSREHKELKQAVTYLEEWGRTFWNETEYRVKEITRKMEDELGRTLEGKVDLAQLALGAKQSRTRSLSQEEKGEIVRRGQEVVSTAQVRDLHQVFLMLLIFR